MIPAHLAALGLAVVAEAPCTRTPTREYGFALVDVPPGVVADRAVVIERRSSR